MKRVKWSVVLKKQAKKADKNLSKAAHKAFMFLLAELEIRGPRAISWPHYSKLGKTTYTKHN